MGSGLRKGLTSYGDAGFSLFLRKAFIKAMGYSEDALDRPIVGITNTLAYSSAPRLSSSMLTRPAGAGAQHGGGRRLLPLPPVRALCVVDCASGITTLAVCNLRRKVAR